MDDLSGPWSLVLGKVDNAPDNWRSEPKLREFPSKIMANCLADG